MNAQQKVEAMRQKVLLAERRIEQAKAEKAPPYVISARRNTLAVACSDLAMAQAFAIIEARGY